MVLKVLLSLKEQRTLLRSILSFLLPEGVGADTGLSALTEVGRVWLLEPPEVLRLGAGSDALCELLG